MVAHTGQCSTTFSDLNAPSRTLRGFFDGSKTSLHNQLELSDLATLLSIRNNKVEPANVFADYYLPYEISRGTFLVEINERECPKCYFFFRRTSGNFRDNGAKEFWTGRNWLPYGRAFIGFFLNRKNRMISFREAAR